jgi:hypothetical protein
LPEFTSLQQNYPNPFNARTTISFELAASAKATLAIFDILGRHIETLVDEDLLAGRHQVTWDASLVASGIYFYKLQAGDKQETRRMLLIK